MRRLFAVTVLAAAIALPVAAQAEGSRMPAGGNLMSSYVDDPNHDPRSVWSQANRTGQILGQPMMHENAGAPSNSRRIVTREQVGSPNWTAGTRTPSKRGMR